MESSDLLFIVQQGLLLTITLSTPPVISALVVGLLISLLQTVTQIQEQTLSFVPKTIAVFGSIAIFEMHLSHAISEFGRTCFESISSIGGG